MRVEPKHPWGRSTSHQSHDATDTGYGTRKARGRRAKTVTSRGGGWFMLLACLVRRMLCTMATLAFSERTTVRRSAPSIGQLYRWTPVPLQNYTPLKKKEAALPEVQPESSLACLGGVSLILPRLSIAEQTLKADLCPQLA